MADRVRRVYRAVAYYPFTGGGEYAVRRHFQTKRARDHWAQQRREGYPWEEGPYIGDGEYAHRPALEPALRVDVADSDPVTFPADAAPDPR